MDIRFSRMFNENGSSGEYEISIHRYNDPFFCRISLKNISDPDPINLNLKCEEINKALIKFNVYPYGSERDTFYKSLNLNPTDYRFISLARIVGILSPRGHFFEVFSNIRIVDDYLLETFSEFGKGLVFVDWDNVIKDNSNQIIYLTSSSIMENNSQELLDLYSEGVVGKIILESSVNKNIEYFWIESDDADSRMNSHPRFKKIIIEDINTRMRKAFK